MNNTFDLDALKEFAIGRWRLDELHGAPHWKRVERNGELLATPECDLTVIRCFAYLHDSCRFSNGFDYEHGPRAAKFIETLKDSYLKGLTDQQFVLLKEAIEKHTSHHQTGIPTIDACFDADRLDLIRVGIWPHPQKMASEKGKQFAANFEEYMKTSGNDYSKLGL